MELDRIEGLLSGLITGVMPFTTRLGLNGSRIIVALREAGAHSPATAQRFHAASQIDEAAFAHLLREGIVRKASPARYYLDEKTLRSKVAFPP